MSDAVKSGEKGRGIIQEVFGKIPLPPKCDSFDPTYDKYWIKRICNEVYTEPARRKAEGINDFISSGDSILDVGCGTGDTLEYLLETREVDGTGLDISDTALAVTSSKGFKTFNIDLTDMDTELDSIYDHIVLFEVAEHIINAEMIMMKLKGKYRKGLYVSTPNLGYIAHRFRLMFGRFPLTYISDPREHVRYWTVKDFLDWSNWLGFKKPQVLGIRGKVKVFGLPARWPSLWASEVVFRFTP
ncbi:MAG: methyltransferase domain-containing protein [Candidatus Aegiribacteria sp.]|nr:methyltransferase domain-containing protein [Candidatus Aegiribacteria sp.]